MRVPRTRAPTTLALGAAGLGLLLGANGAAMCLAPARWFAGVSGVAATGPFNSHFVIDVGLAYLATAVLLLGAAGTRHPAARRALLFASTLWLTGHGLFHLVLSLVHGAPMGAALAGEVAGVHLPALAVLALAFASQRNLQE